MRLQNAVTTSMQHNKSCNSFSRNPRKDSWDHSLTVFCLHESQALKCLQLTTGLIVLTAVLPHVFLMHKGLYATARAHSHAIT